MMRPHIGVKDHHLTVGGVDAVELASEFGTPLYVTDENRIRKRYREFKDSFKELNVEIKYACKANTSLAVLNILRQEGSGADVLSEGELQIALEVGIAPEDIIFTGNNKTDTELKKALDAGVIINLDAVHEMERLEKICEKAGKTARISFRVNPSVSPETHPHLSTGLKESKFGIPEEDIMEAYSQAAGKECFRVCGIHMHIGSQITKTPPYEEATSKLFDIIGKLKRNGIELEFVDLGGGVGIRYQEREEYITPKDLADALVPIIKSKLDQHDLTEPVIFFEPGRFIVGDAAIMLTNVSTIKKTTKKLIGTDAGFHVLLRPILYSAHHEAVVANKMDLKAEDTVDIVGNVCESGDILAKDRLLPKIEAGDIIAFLDAGAYGIIMASRYNSRPIAAEVLVSNGEYDLIRERETIDDLLQKQIVPERLKR
jgi:diaminopimelate decarboxylase